jgi:hypothetical protein
MRSASAVIGGHFDAWYRLCVLIDNDPGDFAVRGLDFLAAH